MVTEVTTPGKLFALPWFIAVALFLCAAALRADDPKPDAKSQSPRIIMALQLAIVRGQKTQLTFRGIGLDTAKEAKASCNGQEIPIEIKSKGKAELPKNVTADKAGDSKLDVEFTAPADSSAHEVAFTITTKLGTSPPYTMRLYDSSNLTPEKKPNNGFASAQPLNDEVSTITGSLGAENEVAVFRISGKAGQTLSAEVFAARLGSMLDSLLTLYDAQGHIVAANDDSDTADSLLRTPLPHEGTYYLSLTDAGGKGGETFPFLLAVKIDKP